MGTPDPQEYLSTSPPCGSNRQYVSASEERYPSMGVSAGTVGGTATLTKGEKFNERFMDKDFGGYACGCRYVRDGRNDFASRAGGFGQVQAAV
jgi:hypothetical protein